MEGRKTKKELFYYSLLKRADIYINKAGIARALNDINFGLNKKPPLFYKYSFFLLKALLHVKKNNDLDSAYNILYNNINEKKITPFIDIFYKYLILKGALFIYKGNFKEALNY